MENATQIEIIGCKIHSAATTGIWLNHAVDSVTIRGNWFEDIGYCGIFAYGFWPGAPESYVKGPNTTAMDTYVNRNNTIDSNVIRNVGTMNYGAAGILLFPSGNNTISRNLINRGPRNAVGLFGPHYVCLSVVNYSKWREPAATAFNKALGGGDRGQGKAQWSLGRMLRLQSRRASISSPSCETRSWLPGPGLPGPRPSLAG